MNELPEFESRVLHNRPLSPTAWELRLERASLEFEAGQLISLHGAESHDARDYTIASGEEDPWIDVLYRHIPHGALTPQLLRLQPGDQMRCSGPYGTFTLRDPHRPLVFVATGTGIAPCRSFLRSHPELALQVFHGVRDSSDLFYGEELARYAYIPCLSTEPGRGYHGRVSGALATLPWDPEAHFYLCGANEMIYEVQDLLKEAGVQDEQVFNEPYYYRHDA